MQIERVTETEEGVLTVLATYRYLTAAHLLRLGVSGSKRHLYATLERLVTRRPQLIGQLEFGVLPGKGRLSRFYHLTPAGAELLAAVPDTPVVSVPSRVRIFNSDYFHRLHCIDFHVALRQWADEAGATIDFFHAYYDPGTRTSRGGTHPKTRLTYKADTLVPDAVFAFTSSDGAHRLCVFEIYNGRRTDRVEKALSAYLPFLDAGAIEDTHSYKHAVRLLIVFEDRQGEELVRARLSGRANFRAFADQLFSKSLAELHPDFRGGWRQFHHDNAVPLF